MSGIVALFQRDGAPIDVALLERMNEAQRYRGPDGERIWYDGSIGLGHTLHKTTLESEREVSPTSLDGRLFITADARIDARDELCERLRGRGIYVRTDVPDPELLLHAYDAWGEDFLQHLLGDFSFALWDAKNRKLVCAVDQLGVKPFFYADRGGLFAASNSLECVRQHPQVRNELNEIAVGDFLLFGCYQARDITIYEDIVRIPPAHYLVVQASGVRLTRYFSLPEPREVEFAKESDVIEQFQELLGKAVRDRLRTPKVAVYMSGGVDSPLVAMTAKKELAKQFGEYEIGAFTCVYDWLIPDEERYYAGLVGKSLGIPVEFQPLDEGRLFDWPLATPPAAPLTAGPWGPWWRQMLTLRERFAVALTGSDGDALLLSAPYLHWRERWQQRRVGALCRDLGWYIANQRSLPPMGVRTRIARAKSNASRAAPLPSWLRKDFVERTLLNERWQRPASPPSRSREPSQRNFEHAAWGRLFDTYDPARFRLAVETRHPLVDLRVIGFTFRLGTIPWCVDKHLLRHVADDLPLSVRTRPKAPLRTDPVRARAFRTKSVSPLSWLEAVDAFLDSQVLVRALSEVPPASHELHQQLRAVGLGQWLKLQRISPLRSRQSFEIAGPSAKLGAVVGPIIDQGKL